MTSNNVYDDAAKSHETPIARDHRQRVAGMPWRENQSCRTAHSHSYPWFVPNFLAALDALEYAIEMEPPPLPPLTCHLCGKPAEDGYAAQLCSVCRTTLSKRPFPIWIKISIVLVAIIFGYALAQIPPSLSASIAFERGQRAEAAGSYESAAAVYADVVEKFPQSTLAVARLGIAQYRAGNRAAAIRTLNSLAGRQPSKELTTEVNAVIAEMQREY